MPEDSKRDTTSHSPRLVVFLLVAILLSLPFAPPAHAQEKALPESAPKGEVPEDPEATKPEPPEKDIPPESSDDPSPWEDASQQLELITTPFAEPEHDITLGPQSILEPDYWWFVPVANPLRNSLASLEVIRAGYSLVGYGLDYFESVIPERFRQSLIGQISWSLGEYLLYSYVTVYLHEFGHYRVARDYGFDASIHNRIVMGWVAYSGTADMFTEQATGDVAVAGLNNQEIYAREVAERRFLGIDRASNSGQIYVTNHTNASYYLLYSLMTGGIGAGDDNVAFRDNLAAWGLYAPPLWEMLAISLAADMLSLDLWARLLGTTHISLGNWNVSFPHFSYLRNAREQFVDARFTLLPPGRTAVGVSGTTSRHFDFYRGELSVGHYREAGNTWIGAKVGGTFGYQIDSGATGYSVFSRIDTLLTPMWGVGAQMVWSSNDLIWNDLLGLRDGFSLVITAQGSAPRFWEPRAETPADSE